jgi:hypothetical protein
MGIAALGGLLVVGERHDIGPALRHQGRQRGRRSAEQRPQHQRRTLGARLAIGFDGGLGRLAAVVGGQRQLLGPGVEQGHFRRLLQGLPDRRGAARQRQEQGDSRLARGRDRRPGCRSLGRHGRGRRASLGLLSAGRQQKGRGGKR